MVRCPVCGLVFQDPQPAEQDLARSYYFDAEFTRSLAGPLRQATVDRARQKLPLVRSIAGRSDPGRALDVGCSSGAWLEVAAAAGWAPTGVEVGPSTAEEARRRGLDVRTGTLEQALPELSGERFDLITFWDVLEHLPDPRTELRLARELLAPRGVVAATLPNVDGWYPRLTHRLFARRTGVWEYPELPVHVHDFSPGTASALLRRCGLEVVATRTWGVPFDHYRRTTLSRSSLGPGWKANALRLASELLHAAVYPLARLFDRGNYQFLAARAAG